MVAQPAERFDMAQSEYESLFSEIKNVHHRLDEFKLATTTIADKVNKLELQQAKEDGASAAMHAMRSESYRVVGAVAAIAAISIGAVQVISG